MRDAGPVIVASKQTAELGQDFVFAAAVEEIVDPRKTRSLLCEFARLAEPLRTPGMATNMTIRP